MNSRLQSVRGGGARALWHIPCREAPDAGCAPAVAPCLGTCAATSLPGSRGKAFRAFPKPRAGERSGRLCGASALHRRAEYCEEKGTQCCGDSGKGTAALPVSLRHEREETLPCPP